MKAKKFLLSLFLFLSNSFFNIKYVKNVPCYGMEYEKDGSCVYREECRYYGTNGYSNYCWYSCPYYKEYNNYDSRECITGCNGEYYYYDEYDINKICYKKEQCNFIDPGTRKCYRILTCQNSANNQYHNFDSNICIPGCSGNRPSYVNGKKTCYPSCKDIPNGTYIYEGRDTSTLCYRSRAETSCDKYYKNIDYSFLKNKHFLVKAISFLSVLESADLKKSNNFSSAGAYSSLCSKTGTPAVFGTLSLCSPDNFKHFNICFFSCQAYFLV